MSEWYDDAGKGWRLRQELRAIQTDLAWMAGFFDGEGYIGLGQTSEGCYALHVAITQVAAAESLEPFLQFGGKLSPKNMNSPFKVQPTVRWEVTGPKALECLVTLRPYLRSKGTQADVAIAFQQRRLSLGEQNSATGRASKTARREADEHDYWKLRELKRGVPGRFVAG